MSDGHYPLPGAYMGRNHHPTGLILMNNTWHISEHGLGRVSKNYNHLSNGNQITEGRHNFLWQRKTGILTKRGGHPLHSLRFCHGTLSGQIVPVNNHDHGTMGKQRPPVVYPHPSQWHLQGHQYPHDNQSYFLHNTRYRSFLPDRVQASLRNKSSEWLE